MSPEAVVPAAVYLVSEDAPNRVMLAAGGGGFERAYVTLTRGVRLEADNVVGGSAGRRISRRSAAGTTRSSPTTLSPSPAWLRASCSHKSVVPLGSSAEGARFRP